MPRRDVLTCLFCGKSVSTEFVAHPTDTPDQGLIVRAIVACPECFASRFSPRDEADRARRDTLIGALREAATIHEADGHQPLTVQLLRTAADVLAVPDHGPLDAMAAQLDGQPWDADTLDAIVDVRRRAGYTIRDVDETDEPVHSA